MTRVSLILCFSILLIASTVNCDCELSFGMKWNDKFQPMLLKNGHRIQTRDKKIVLKNEETVNFACPGQNNQLRLTNKNVSPGTCLGGQTFNLAGILATFENIQCKNRITAKPKNEGKNCSGGGKLFSINFQVNQTLYRNFDVCYDVHHLNPLYSSHTIDGRNAGFSTTSNEYIGFSNEGLRRAGVDRAYTQKVQKATLNKILRNTRKTEEYINTNSYFVRGHLATKSHFVFSYEQYGTNFYLNVAPQWNQVNNANWKSVERTVRNLIESKRNLFTIITGTHGILSLKDKNNNLVPIYLHRGNKMPVPKFIWKIVYQQSTKAGIVFVQINNPFITDAEVNEEKKKFCTNVCSVAGFDDSNWSEKKKGFVFCCELEDFFEVVKTVPRMEAPRLLTSN